MRETPASTHEAELHPRGEQAVPRTAAVPVLLISFAQERGRLSESRVTIDHRWTERRGRV